jgi:hypothetical protein
LIGQRVRVEVGASVDLGAAFEHEDIGSEVGEASRESAAAGAGADDYYVVEFS